MNIEVWFKNKLNLSCFKFFFKTNSFSQDIDQIIFFHLIKSIRIRFDSSQRIVQSWWWTSSWIWESCVCGCEWSLRTNRTRPSKRTVVGRADCIAQSLSHIVLSSFRWWGTKRWLSPSWRKRRPKSLIQRSNSYSNTLNIISELIISQVSISICIHSPNNLQQLKIMRKMSTLFQKRS